MSESEITPESVGAITISLPTPSETPQELVDELWEFARALRSFEHLSECEQLNWDDPPDAWRCHLQGLEASANDLVGAARRLLSDREDRLAELLPLLMVIRRHVREATEFAKLMEAFGWDGSEKLADKCYAAARSHVCRLEETTAHLALSFGSDVGESSWPLPKTIPDRVLQVLFECKAFDDASRLTTASIAEKADGPGTNPEKFKEPVSNLSRRQFVSTRSHRGGGVWLAPRGRRLAERRFANR